MLRKTFEYRIDPDQCTLGWVPKGAPALFNSGNGTLVAHDILEHTADTTDSWEDELMAFGAMIFIRGEQGYFAGRFSPRWELNLASDLTNCLLSLGRPLKKIVTHRIKGIDDGIDTAIRIACREAKNSDVTIPMGTREGIRNWVRKGYRNARRRFGSGAKTCNLFMLIESEVDRLSKFAEEGFDELKVSVNLRKWMADVKLLPAQYDDYY